MPVDETVRIGSTLKNTEIKKQYAKALREHHPDWQKIYIELLLQTPIRIHKTLMAELIDNKASAALLEFFTRLRKDSKNHAEIFMWSLKNLLTGDPMDKVKPGPISRIGPPWSRNGSLLAFRRLRQDVAKFHAFLVAGARELARREPALADLTPEKLAAKLMGRWRSGAPVLRAPEDDIPALGEDEGENNHFTYIKPSPAIPAHGSGRRSDASFPRSLGDSLGLMCPHAAHIRRAYPRDATTVEISEANIEIHRLLRRGIPFGEPLPDPGERGLLFLAYQTSFERQFEFVTRAWLNNPNFRNSGDGHDPIIGQNFEGQGDRTRKFAIPVRDSDGSVRKVHLVLPDDWVIPTGGGYFFAPSTSALEYLAS